VGLHARDLKGLKPDQLFELLADAVARASDKSKALAAVSRILGEESSRKFAPALMGGAAAIRELRMQAHELGLVLDDDALRATKEVAVQWRQLKQVGRGLATELAVRLAPDVAAVLRGVLGWVKANRELLSQRIDFWVRQLERGMTALNLAVRVIGGWDVVFLNVAQGAGLLYLIANLDRLQHLLKLLRVGFTALQVVAEPVLAQLQVQVGALLAELGIGLAPLLLILGGFVFYLGLAALAVDDFLTFWRGGKSVLGDNLDAIERLFPAFRGFRDLVAALVGVGGAAVRTLVMIGAAVLNGLSPAFQLLDQVLESVAERLREIGHLWDQFNIGLGLQFEGAAAGVRSWTARNEGAGWSMADRVNRSVSSAVQAQVDRVSGGSSSVDNSSRSVEQTNNFWGGGGADHLRNLDSALRGARIAVAGGSR
jgi:hypothetical protein